MTEEVKDKVIRTKDTNTKANAVLSMFDTIAEDVLSSVQAKIDRRVSQKVKKLEDAINQARPIYVVSENFESQPVDGIQHHNFETLIRIVHTGQPVMLVGPAGTGKSHAAEQTAQVLGLEFYAMSVGAQTSKSDLIGYMDAMKNYVSTPFRKAYEEGGLFLLDEIDAGNSNVLIQLNAALANGYMSFPDEMIRRHDNFRFIASANTYGMGANRQYVGRNQLDAATLDRFVSLQWDIDTNVEESLAVGKHGNAWLGVVRMVRDYVQERDLRVVVSPRATQRGSKLLAAGLDFNDVLHMALLSQFSADEKSELHVKSHTAWRETMARLSLEENNESSTSSNSDGDIADDSNGSDSDSSRPAVKMLMEGAASAARIDDAYQYVLSDKFYERNTDEISDEMTSTIVTISDEAGRWNALKNTIECADSGEHINVQTVAFVKKLREIEWDFRSYAKDYN